MCGEGTSLLKEEGGITPTPASSSRMFRGRLALWPGLFLVVSEEILGRGIFSGALNSWEDISLASRLEENKICLEVIAPLPTTHQHIKIYRGHF